MGEPWRRQRNTASCVRTLLQFISHKAALTEAVRNKILAVVDEPGSDSVHHLPRVGEVRPKSLEALF